MYKTPERKHLTVAQQTARLPLYLQEYYKTTLLDRIQIDGNEIQGYFEYSYFDEKTYALSPIRSSDGTIDNLNSYSTFLTPRLVIKYKYMHISDYRKLMKLLISKNEFSVSCYDIVADTRVTHNMYLATPSMPTIHQRNLQVLGVLDYTIELIGTNTDFEEYTVTYNYNIPSTLTKTVDGVQTAVTWTNTDGTALATSATQTIPRNISDNIGGANAQYTYDNNLYNLAKQTIFDNYKFQGWCETADGKGFIYLDNDAYFITANTTLYAKWVASV